MATLLRVVALAAFALVVVQVRSSKAQNTTPCRTPDGYATYMKSYFAGAVSGTDSVSAELRELYELPAAPDTSVAFVTDSLVCSQALTAYTTAMNQVSPVSNQIDVLRVGATRLIAWHSPNSGKFAGQVVFDTSFVELVTVQ